MRSMRPAPPRRRPKPPGTNYSASFELLRTVYGIHLMVGDRRSPEVLRLVACSMARDCACRADSGLLTPCCRSRGSREEAVEDPSPLGVERHLAPKLAVAHRDDR